MLKSSAQNSHISSLLTYLRRIRQPYLSTAPPPRHRTTSSAPRTIYLTDPQRAEIDSSTSLLLRDLSKSISNLSEAENIRAATEARVLEQKYGKPKNFLWSWAGGDNFDDESPKSEQQRIDEGKAQTLKTFRGSVIWYLETNLAKAAARQSEMVEVRVKREREKEKSVLWKLGAGGDFAYVNGSARSSSPRPDSTQSQVYNPALSQDDSSSMVPNLSPEQLQLFSSENSTLLNHYNDQLARVTEVEKSAMEIAALHQTLLSHLNTQEDMIQQLAADQMNTGENVDRGNKELKKATERTSTAKMVFWATVGLCGFLVGWDLVF